jgi:cytochrome P450
MEDVGTVYDNIPTDPERQAELQEFARRRCVEPRSYFSELRQRCPVDFREGKDGNVQVLRRPDVDRVLRDTDLFSNAMGIMGSQEPVIPLGVDPPEHATYRRLLDPIFSKRRMAQLEPKVTSEVNEVIDSFISRGECDFSTELAIPLPCSTFLSLIGLPQERLAEFIRWVAIMIRPAVVAGNMEDGIKLQAETGAQVYEYFTAIIAERRGKPGEDLISMLLTGEIDGGRRLEDSEILRALFLLLAAGIDTVTISLQCIFNYLIEHPEARTMLITEPTTVDSLVEELLRWETPVQGGIARRATRDTELSGCPIPAGTMVIPMLAAANLDPDFPDALTVDLRRTDKRHLSFGGGPHRCLGSHLARMELRTIIREWHRRIPEYRLKPGVTVEWNGSDLRGIPHLPLEWDVPTKGPR